MPHEKDLVISYFDGRLPDQLAAGAGASFKAAVVAMASVGDSPQRGRIVELGVLLAEVERDPVRFTRVLGRYHGFEDPGEDLDGEDDTGLTDDMLRDRRLDDGAVEALLQEADLVIAYNAGGVRPHLERRYPSLESKIFACCRNQIEWPEKGQECRCLRHLAMGHGWHFDSRRADVLCAAIVRLLSEKSGPAGSPYLAELVKRANEPLITVEVEVPPQFRRLIKQERFIFDKDRHCWTRSMGTSSLDRVRRNLAAKGFDADMVECERLPASERFK